jgi:glycosyltransferase involved in cell wall biosynthesis
VLRAISRLNAGGPTRHVVWLSEGLRERGWETQLLAGRVPEGEDDLSGFARERGVEVTEVPDLSREVRPLRDWGSVQYLEAAIEDFDPDVVHTHTAKAGFVGRWAALRANRRRLRAGRPPIRVVHTFHGNVLSGYFSPAKSLLFRGIERQLARRASDAIVVLSPQQREDIVTRFRVAPPERTFLVPLAIDLSEYEPLPEAGAFRSELGFGANEFVVGIVGRVAPVKNHELFLRAAALLARRVPGARFVVLGGGAGLTGLRRIASELGVAERVRFVGVRTDLSAVYAGLDAVALTSLNEGTPLSLIEAMSAGKPAVATDVGGVRDLLTAQWDGPVEARRFVASPRPRGLLVPSGEVEAFAVALERLAGDRSLRHSLGEAGRLHAFKYHSLPRLLEDVDRLYRLTLER